MSDKTDDRLDGTARAIEDHDPAREPYASMDREEIAELMNQEELSGYELERLHEHFLDKCS